MGQTMKVQLRDKSGIRLYRFLVEDVDRHGNVRIYFRRKGQPKIRLTEMPGTAAFDAEYHRAFNDEVKLPSASQHTAWMPGTLGWLCEQYYASAVFQALDKSTRKTPARDPRGDLRAADRWPARRHVPVRDNGAAPRREAAR